MVSIRPVFSLVDDGNDCVISCDLIQMDAKVDLHMSDCLVWGFTTAVVLNRTCQYSNTSHGGVALYL